MKEKQEKIQIDEAIALVDNAKHPEDVFGRFDDIVDTKTIYESVYKRYKQLCSLIHPDRQKITKYKDLCEKSFAKLSVLWASAKKQIENKVYGKVNISGKSVSKITFKSFKYMYTILDRLCYGETRGIFSGTLTDKKNNTIPCIIKIPHNSKDNDLMKNEHDSYLSIRRYATEQSTDYFESFSLRFPSIIESVNVKSNKDGTVKIVNIFVEKENSNDHLFTIEQIRKKHSDGVNTRIATFIFNRILETLTFAHAAKICNGSVTPNHIMINSKTHNGTIIDWTSSFCLFPAVNTKLPYLDKRYRDFYATDIVNKERKYHMSDDVFSAAACIFYILGGCLEKKTISREVDTNILSFLNKCMQPSPRNRPKDAIIAYQEFQEIINKSFGKKREFAVLEM